MSLTNDLKSKKIPSDMVLCKICKEPMMANDKICKHCYEYQKEEDFESTKETSLGNTCLSLSDWITILFFQLIGIIIGIAHLLNGEKIRGKKVIRFSLISVFINLIISGSIFTIFKTFTKLLRAGLD